MKIHLCKWFLIQWFLIQWSQSVFAARSEENGRIAMQELAKENLRPHFHQLDIQDDTSICRFAQYMKQTHRGVDVLVNNAAIAIDVGSKRTCLTHNLQHFAQRTKLNRKVNVQHKQLSKMRLIRFEPTIRAPIEWHLPCCHYYGKMHESSMCQVDSAC